MKPASKIYIGAYIAGLTLTMSMLSFGDYRREGSVSMLIFSGAMLVISIVCNLWAGKNAQEQGA